METQRWQCKATQSLLLPASGFLWWATVMNQALQALHHQITLNPLQWRELTQIHFVWSSTSHAPRVSRWKSHHSASHSEKPTWNNFAASHPALIDGMILFWYYIFKGTKSRGEPLKPIFPHLPPCYPKWRGTIVWGSTATFPVVRNICCSIATFAIFRFVLVCQESLLCKVCFCLTVIFLAPSRLSLGTNP